jgi:hypothetical protein
LTIGDPRAKDYDTDDTDDSNGTTPWSDDLEYQMLQSTADLTIKAGDIVVIHNRRRAC